MNNRFIPIISVFMTISLIVFVTLQINWLKGYYRALQEQFSNRVYTALESGTAKLEQLEVNRYYAEYKNFKNTVIAESGNPVQHYIEQSRDSANRSTIAYNKTIIEKQNIPVSNLGDSLNISKVYSDEGLYNIRRKSNSPAILTTKINNDISTGEFAIREFAQLSASNLPIEKRVTKAEIDSVMTRELKLNGIDTKFAIGILDKDNKLTKMVDPVYQEEKERPRYAYPLYRYKDQTQYTLSLVFPLRDYSLAGNNLMQLLGTFFSLLTILGIYIISINYMMRQKKIAEVKTDFLNNMSHEFKTPLATISVAADSLATDMISHNSEKVKYYSALIKQENLRMKKQVENVLNMSKLERNEVKLFLKETNVRELIGQISESFGLLIAQRNGTLTQDFRAEKYIFKVDEFHLQNTLLNLLDNANKYSPEAPQINIATKNEGNFYVIQISDKGMGMETGNKTKIFEKFFREETGNIHNVKGQGLGLTYVKKIIELHKGSISVDSQKGKGSTFTIKLPMA